MNIAFIEPASKEAVFFHEVSKYFPSNIYPVFISSNPKVISRLRKIGANVLNLDKLRPSKEVPSIAEIEASKGPLIRMKFAGNQKIEERSFYVYRRLSRIIDELSISFIVVWGGTGLETSIASHLISKKERGSTIYCQNGYFPQTIQVDTEGSNYWSSITPKMETEIEKLTFDNNFYEELMGAISNYKKGENIIDFVPPYSVRPSIASRIRHFFKTRDLQWNRIKRLLNRPNSRIRWCDEKLPDRYVFLPLQVRGDSQLWLHSPLITDDLPRLICISQKSIQGIKRDCPLVVKLHPLDTKSDYNEVSDAFPDVFFVRKTPVRNLLKNASAVITVNSTVGFEALFYYKPVVMVGNNFYGIHGIVHKVNKMEEFDQALNAALTEPVDKERIDKMLYFVYHHFLVKGHYKNFSTASISAVGKKIMDIIDPHGVR